MPCKLMKQLMQLIRNADSFTDGQVKVNVDAIDFDSPLEDFKITICPNDGPYCGGTFVFEINLREHGAPDVNCGTPIYHPNIDPDDSSICFNLINDDLWRDNTTLEDLVQGLLWLLYNPAIDDPLSHLFDGSESWEEFVENVRTSLNGGEIRGYDFPRNLTENCMNAEKATGAETPVTATDRPQLIRRQSCFIVNDVTADVRSGVEAAPAAEIRQRLRRTASLGAIPSEDCTWTPRVFHRPCPPPPPRDGPWADSYDSMSEDDDPDDDDDGDRDSLTAEATGGTPVENCQCRFPAGSVDTVGTSVDHCHTCDLAGQSGIKHFGRRMSEFVLSLVRRR